ncbi:MAG: PCRF domain-containing protein, partial [Bacteroidales bacterium]|nr:PCRF domain-containing protein [Bacteroidales bacterium]
MFDIDRKLIQIKEEEEKTQASGFWKNPKEAEKKLKKISNIKGWTKAYQEVQSSFDDLTVIYDFYKEEEASEQEVDEQYNSTLKLTET